MSNRCGWWLRVSAAALLLAIPFASGCRDGGYADFDKCLEVLISKFETIYFADVQVVGELWNSRRDEATQFDKLKVLADVAAWALERGGLVPELSGGEHRLLMGARNFQPPVRVGVAHFDACYVLLQSVPRRIDLAKRLGRDPVGMIMDTPVWSWRAEAEHGDFWQFFVVQPDVGAVLLATSQDSLREVMEGMTDKTIPRRDHLSSPLWQALNAAGSPIWAVRYYRQVEGWARRSTGLSFPDYEVGSNDVAFSVSINRARTDALLTHLARLDEPGPLRMWNGGGQAAPRRLGAGVWQRSVDLTKTDVELILTLLGFRLAL